MNANDEASADATASAEATARAEADAHRAIVEAMVAGLFEPRAGVRVIAGTSASADAAADLVVMTDDGAVGDDALRDLMKRQRAVVGDRGVVALVIASSVAAELESAARRVPEVVAANASGDAYARAIAWARARSSAPFDALPPAVTRDRLASLVDAAAASGLVLVEPDTAAVAPAAARVRGMRTARARALLATIVLGARRRPLLFVSAARAPKGGLARLKVERLADGWVAAARGTVASASLATSGALSDAALAILAESRRDGRGPVAFKQLLREARDRWSAAARLRGERVTASATDASELATALHRTAAREDVLLYALDPAAPGWSFTVAQALVAPAQRERG